MAKKPNKRAEDAQKSALVDAFVKARAQEMVQKQVAKKHTVTVDYLAKHEFALERMEKIAERFAMRSFIPKYKGSKKVTERKLNLILSDLHYGANLDARLVNYPYGPVEEARRTAAICVQAADYKRQYRANTELDIHLIGDIIQGKLHDVQDAACLTEQFDRAMWALVHGIEFLATEFKQVNVKTSVGNHGRDAVRHPERAMQDKYDSNEFRIYRALRYRFEKVPNIKFETPMRGYYLYDQFGMKGCMTHGDTIFNPGYPGKMIDVQKLKMQVDSFKMGHPDNRDVILFGMGHVHTAMDVDIGGNTIITNGCLIPTDEYAQSVGIYNTPCRQQLWETVPGYMFGDHRRLIVDERNDKDASLDKVVPVWTDLES